MNIKWSATNHPRHRGVPFARAAAILSLLLAVGVSAQGAQDDAAVAAAAAADTTTRVVVAYKPAADSVIRQAVSAAHGKFGTQQAATSALADAKVTTLFSGTMSAMSVELPKASLVELSSNPNVAFVEEDFKRYLIGGLRHSSSSSSPRTGGERDLLSPGDGLTSPSTGTPYATGQLVPYGIKMVQANLLANTDASNMKVCIIDTGYDIGHEDLPSDGSIVTGEDNFIAPWYYDFWAHGTHVAGTISALNNDGTGVVGVHSNNSLKLHIINVFGDSDYVSESDIVSAAFKCVNAGANVISMSLGGNETSKWESMAYEEISKKNILLIAAAGNDGISIKNYPAGYSSVVSVAAVDVNRAVADFSTFNSDVELAGPGVGVLSTIPAGMSYPLSKLVVGTTEYDSNGLYGSPTLSASAPLANFGIGNQEDATVSGKVCLIQRGMITPAEKVLKCQNSGGIAAVIYNNVPGEFYASLGGEVTAIPSLFVSDVTGAALLNQLGQTATVTVMGDYDYFDGTSMATPHVSAVAALVWARNPKCTAAQLRTSLAKSALDLGKKGRDMYYGYGLVQAKAADDRIKKRGCGK